VLNNSDGTSSDNYCVFRKVSDLNMFWKALPQTLSSRLLSPCHIVDINQACQRGCLCKLIKNHYPSSCLNSSHSFSQIMLHPLQVLSEWCCIQSKIILSRKWTQLFMVLLILTSSVQSSWNENWIQCVLWMLIVQQCSNPFWLIEVQLYFRTLEVCMWTSVVNMFVPPMCVQSKKPFPNPLLGINVSQSKGHIEWMNAGSVQFSGSSSLALRNMSSSTSGLWSALLPVGVASIGTENELGPS